MLILVSKIVYWTVWDSYPMGLGGEPCDRRVSFTILMMNVIQLKIEFRKWILIIVIALNLLHVFEINLALCKLTILPFLWDIHLCMSFCYSTGVTCEHGCCAHSCLKLIFEQGKESLRRSCCGPSGPGPTRMRPPADCLWCIGWPSCLSSAVFWFVACNPPL